MAITIRRKTRRGRRFALLALLAAGVCAVACRSAQADGGKLQSSEQVGPWIVSLFTSPTPAAAGPVDVSVLVQRADTREPVRDVLARIVAREERSGFTVQKITTREAATNQLFQAAWLDLSTPGRWTITAHISRGETAVNASCLLSVSPPLPHWSDLTYWIMWPCVPIGLYVAAQIHGSRAARGLH